MEERIQALMEEGMGGNGRAVSITFFSLWDFGSYGQSIIRPFGFSDRFKPCLNVLDGSLVSRW